MCHGICSREQLHGLDITPRFFFLIFHLLLEEFALLFAFGTVFGYFLWRAGVEFRADKGGG
jgi:hypothetical protein